MADVQTNKRTDGRNRLHVTKLALGNVNVQQARFHQFGPFLFPNNLEGQCQSPPFSIVLWSVPLSSIGADLVMLAKKRDKLSREKARFFFFFFFFYQIGAF